ncbi:MAG: hypothetical protein K6D59_03070 [Bacteroidales bacterium]|nr:hypothetical protein [Bacteroidales bacterium]
MAAEFVNIGDAVEGSKVEIYTRKETWKGMRLDPMTKKVMMVCELERNCSAEITETVNLTDEQRDAHDKYANSVGITLHRDLGDKLKAFAITVYTDAKKRLPVEVKEGQTSTHGGHLISCPKYTLAIIKYPFVAIASKFLPANEIKKIENKNNG